MLIHTFFQFFLIIQSCSYLVVHAYMGALGLWDFLLLARLESAYDTISYLPDCVNWVFRLEPYFLKF